MKTLLSRMAYSTNSGNLSEVPLWQISDFSLNDDTSRHAAIAFKLNNDLYNGYYVEIGVGHYQNNNHTYGLEKHYGWKGISLDIVEHNVNEFNLNRKNECVLGNALTFNWKKYFEENNFPKEIDYLQIDIDQNSHKFANLFAFLNLPIHEYKFKIITIEHAERLSYYNKEVRDLQRQILSSLGYNLLFRGKIDDVWTLEVPITDNGLDDLANWENFI